MRYEYKGRNIEISDKLKEISEKKLERLSKFFSPDTKVYVTYRAENRNTVVAEITIPVQGSSPIRAEVKDTDKYAALDQAMDKLERQIVKYRKKLQARAKQDKTLNPSYFTATPDDAEEETMVVRRIERVPAKPMDVSEACLQMELLGHDFFVFRNIANQQINVVYKRKEAGTYGLIETED